MSETLRSGSVTTKLQRIAELASKDRKRAFTSVSHVIDLDWMKEAYRRTRKDGAVGVDGRTAADYAQNLEAKLRSVLDQRVRDGVIRRLIDSGSARVWWNKDASGAPTPAPRREASSRRFSPTCSSAGRTWRGA